jgi:CheY-like chemotaxis protein
VQIVGNLLHNASKFTPEGGEIRVQLSFADGHAFVRVVDAGVGIASEQLQRVFEMFTRVSGPGVSTNNGLGIGLALSRKLAEMHGGQLTADSDGLGKGSTFTLSLPAELGAEPAGPRSQTLPPIAPRDAPTNIVVIEDNRDSAELLVLSLQSRGFVPSVAHTGTEGLALIEERQPQVVLCDIGLPGMSGLEVCQRVRELNLEQQPVMIALTGWGMTEDIRRTRESGFDHHLVKPIAPQALFELLDRVTTLDV